MINNSFNNLILQLIRNSAFCPLCSSNNEKKNQTISAQILDKNEKTASFYLKCNNCGASMISIVSTDNNMGSGILFLTDLTPEEILSFKEKTPITTKDLKDIGYLINN
ncbi:MAG TPA: hypothetical protein PLM63_00295 [bacterium]|nr:hypothetical protein [bacterium]HPO11017.1 hypothetical protein [bacterium]